MVTSLGVTPGSSLVTTTLLSPSQILIGGNSRLVGVNPENTRFISLCIRRSSTKGSKPKPGKFRKGHGLTSLHVDTSVAADSDQLGTQERGRAHTRADNNHRRRSPVPHGGEEWVTITSSLRSDMTAAGQQMVRPSFPAEIRQAASGTASISHAPAPVQDSIQPTKRCARTPPSGVWVLALVGSWRSHVESRRPWTNENRASRPVV